MLITIGSVTTASRLAKLIEREAHLKASVMHTPSELNKGGCSYSVRVNCDDYIYISSLLKKYNIRIKHCYKEVCTPEGCVYNVLS